MTTRQFSQVDVFSETPFGGNPVAVVHDADGMTDAEMAAFARWTNLSETTFLVAPRDRNADYGLRIFTPGGELPFAGHPTLGSCHAWLERGGRPRDPDAIVQECGVGLVALRRDGGRLAFAAPPLRRTGPLDPETLDRVIASLRVDASAIVGHQWIDNGPGWIGVLLDSAASVLAIDPDFTAMRGLAVGVVGLHPDRGMDAAADAAFEVRGFVPDLGVPEDPVTGSLNAGIAQWLITEGIAPSSYVAAQGRAVGRAGRIHIDQRDGETWVGGATVTRITGTLDPGD
ncbi:PhzF family phenazine biosynthesis protein [Marisediminicola senii]|uniref:PhzF family phenazine biosynthesis protein n=1 Tax=Marisediminicola senii TaxID=2711233 RepID=UPI0013EAEAFC|nr:PhzF family phenazine biosynthesis protein [Marisediminicola senii]